MLGGGYWDRARNNHTQNLFKNVTPLLANAHMAVGNLEGPLTERPVAAPTWRFCLRGHPLYAQVLRAAGFGALSLANNHVMDFGWEGAEETIDALSKAGIRTFGAGVNLAAARAPLRMSLAGKNVAFLGYSDVPVNLPIFATGSAPGVALANVEHMIQDIRVAKQNSDLVVVCLHWGHEMLLCPSPGQRKVARQLIAAGANVILGHHPHVLQGIERVNRGLVAYSLGTYSVCEEEWIGKNRNGETFRLMHMGPNDGWRRQAVLTIGVDADGSVVTHRMDPTYIATDMCVAPDARPERVEELKRSNALLQQWFYSLRWGTQALRARVIDWAEHVDDGTPLWKLAFRLRPRHLKWITHSLVNEWQQFRGLK
jgi:hypothetical protein